MFVIYREIFLSFLEFCDILRKFCLYFSESEMGTVHTVIIIFSSRIYFDEFSLLLQTPLQTPIQTPLPGTADSSMYNIPTGPSDYPTPTSNEGVGVPNDIKPGVGRPSPYMVFAILLVKWLQICLPSLLYNVFLVIWQIYL